MPRLPNRRSPNRMNTGATRTPPSARAAPSTTSLGEPDILKLTARGSPSPRSRPLTRNGDTRVGRELAELLLGPRSSRHCRLRDRNHYAGARPPGGASCGAGVDHPAATVVHAVWGIRRPDARRTVRAVFFSLRSWELALLILAVIGSATAVGYTVGRYLRKHEEQVREPFGVLQGALLGVVGLILAFGLSLAVGRYEDRRAATVDEANAIGTSYLRAQLIAEPARTRSLGLLREYTDRALQVSREIPNSSGMRRTTAAEGVLQRRLWRVAGQ